jgi:hypothetical protein
VGVGLAAVGLVCTFVVDAPPLFESLAAAQRASRPAPLTLNGQVTLHLHRVSRRDPPLKRKEGKDTHAENTVGARHTPLNGSHFFRSGPRKVECRPPPPPTGCRRRSRDRRRCASGKPRPCGRRGACAGPSGHTLGCSAPAHRPSRVKRRGSMEQGALSSMRTISNAIRFLPVWPPTHRSTKQRERPTFRKNVDSLCDSNPTRLFERKASERGSPSRGRHGACRLLRPKKT